MTTRGILAVVAAALLATAGRTARAQATPKCDPAQPVQLCIRKFGLDPDAPTGTTSGAADARTDDAQARLAGKSTGGEADLPNTETAIRNFLPRFAMAALTPGLSDDRAALGFSANLPLTNRKLFPFGATLKAEVVANKPQVFQSLLDAAPESRRQALADRLGKTLEDYDDATLRLGANLENASWGRSMAPHRNTISRVAGQIMATFRAPLLADIAAWNKVMNAAMRNMPPERASAAGCADATEFGEFRLDCFAPNDQTAIVTTLESIAGSSAQLDAITGAAFRRAGFYRLVDLVNNQPQLNGRFEYRSRRDIVGPNELAGQLRLEAGLATLNRLRSHCGRRPEDGGVGSREIDAECLRTYVDDPEVQRSLDRSDRFWAQVDVARQNRYAVSLPDDSASLSLDPTWSVTPSVGYGAYFGQNADGTDRGRIDLELKYVFEEKASRRQDRAVGSATFTQRLTDQASALITLAYASKTEYLGAVDKKLRAHLGLSYKLLQPAK